MQEAYLDKKSMVSKYHNGWFYEANIPYGGVVVELQLCMLEIGV